MGKYLIIKPDLRVSVSKTNKIVDDSALRYALPSINFLADRGGKIILYNNYPHNELVAERLKIFLSNQVYHVCEGEGEHEVKEKMSSMENGDVILIPLDKITTTW